MRALFLFALVFSLGAPIAKAEDEGSVPSIDAGDSAVSTEPAKGDSKNPKAKIVYRKKTNVSFDDNVIEGAGNNPEGVYVVTPPDKQFGSLLKLRPNFHRELMRDALLLK